MHPPRSDIWRHVPGYDTESDSGGSQDGDGEENELTDSAKQRFQDILAVLGDRWVDPPQVKFVPAQIRQSKGERPDPRRVERPRNTPVPTFRMERMLAPVVHDTFLCNGFNETHGSDWCIQWSGPGMRDSAWSDIHEYQRVNHFPGSTELTRKDSMYIHLNGMAKHFGRECFDFLPETYVLPDQLQAFMEEYEREGGLWIVKPANSACGRGIFILRSIHELPHGASVVSRYVDNPLLIQGLKFDLRVYVLVTQYDPLRAYIYREGLARFASKAYSTEEGHLQDAYRHLTNYSINKSAPNFMENQELNADHLGHKWSLSALNRHLRCVGVDYRTMWSRIMDLIVKTLLAVEPSISSHTRRVTVHQGICFEIYGFDVLVDEALKPWILEVNLSPSMQADSPLDWQVKSSLLSDAFNLIGVCHADFRMISASRLRGQIAQMRASHRALLKERGSNSMTGLGAMSPKRGGGAEGAKRSATKKGSIAAVPSGPSPMEVPVVLDTLSETQLKLLARSLQEVHRCENFIRLYPTRATVERYRPITDARACRPRTSLMGSAAPANQLLASLLFGPPPRRTSSSVAQQMQPGAHSSSSALASSLRRGFKESLQRSLSALQRTAPAAQREQPPPPAADGGGAAEGGADVGAGAGRGGSVGSTSGAAPGEGDAEEGREASSEHSDSPRLSPQEREAEVARATHFVAGLEPEERSRLVVMEYLVRVARACEALGAEERAHLAQTAAYSRLSKFRSRLQLLTARSPSRSGQRPASRPPPSPSSTSRSPQRPSSTTSGSGCLVDEIVASCRNSLASLSRPPWRPPAAPQAGAGGCAAAPRLEPGLRALSLYLPPDFGQDDSRRQALDLLPVLGTAELEGLLRSQEGSEEYAAWRELFASVEPTGRQYSPLSDITQARGRSIRRPPSLASNTAAALDTEAGFSPNSHPSRHLDRRPSLEALGGSAGWSRQVLQHAGSWRSLRQASPPGMPEPAPPPPLVPVLPRQWSAPLLPELKAPERPQLMQKQQLEQRIRQKSSHLIMGNSQQVASSLGRPPFASPVFEMDSIEL